MRPSIVHPVTPAEDSLASEHKKDDKEEEPTSNFYWG